MIYLALVLGTLALLVGFVVLTHYETKYQKRFFAEKRARLDMRVERIEFIIEHVDLSAFVKDEIRHAMNHIGHTVAHLSLQAVRFVERLLTRLVRYLRVQHEDIDAPRESTREFVKTLSDFKGGLNAAHPEVGVPETASEVE